MLNDLRHEDFSYISKRVYDYCKLNLTEKKKTLIVSRLRKRLTLLKLKTFEEYVEYLKFSDLDNSEFLSMIDFLSTNYSHFYRENYHFEFLQKKILPNYNNRCLNIWSAAASTGQEIYTVLITIEEFIKTHNLNISYSLYASDISTRVLKQASSGMYKNDEVKDFNKKILKEYFLQGTGSKSDYVKIKKEYIEKIRFFRTNLNDTNYNIPQMDIIFLRNVIIYFDKESKIEILSRLHQYLKVGGYLILGHSESLTGICDNFTHIDKSIYIKEKL